MRDQTSDQRRPFLAIPLAAILALAACAPAPAPGAAAPAPGQAAASATHATLAATAPTSKELLLRNGMRRLWEDHVTWTRLFIVSFAANLPDADATAGRLLKNQEDIGGAVGTYYGAPAGEKLTGLLKEHILVAVDVLKAAKAADTKAFETANTKWYANMDEISGFLSSANPTSWPAATLRPVMRTHLDLTLEEASARLKGDWATDIAAYEKIHTHILEMADTLSDGIVKQFPERFR